MATIPSYITWTAGQVVTAAQLLSQIRDPGNFWLAKPYVDVDNNAGQACANGVATLIPWDTENEDNDAMHSTVTNPSRIICQTPGVFRLHYYVRTPTTVTVQPITLNLRLNSGGSSSGGGSLSTTNYIATGSGSTTQCERSLCYRFANIGDYLELFVTQNQGSSQTLQAGNRVTGMTAMFEIA